MHHTRNPLPPSFSDWRPAPRHSPDNQSLWIGPYTISVFVSSFSPSIQHQLNPNLYTLQLSWLCSSYLMPFHDTQCELWLCNFGSSPVQVFELKLGVAAPLEKWNPILPLISWSCPSYLMPCHHTPHTALWVSVVWPPDPFQSWWGGLHQVASPWMHLWCLVALVPAALQSVGWSALVAPDNGIAATELLFSNLLY